MEYTTVFDLTASDIDTADEWVSEDDLRTFILLMSDDYSGAYGAVDDYYSREFGVRIPRRDDNERN
jgi:hypothetical protein